MDRRQRRTRGAIFEAFIALLSQKNYGKITVQEIIDAADVGRTTFYAHFETKDDLLQGLCSELFDHIVGAALDRSHTHGRPPCGVPVPAFCHLLQHLQENDKNVLELLACESKDLFLRYFKNSLNALVRAQIKGPFREGLPEDFLVNHISATFVEMVLWWLQTGCRQTPEELAGYFAIVAGPFMSPDMGVWPS